MSDSGEKKVILSVFAHPDDELGAIGTLANHARRGDDVYMCWTTYGENTSKYPNLTPQEVKIERKRHAEEIAKIIGAKEIRFMDYGDTMVEPRRDYAVQLAKLYCEIQPDAIITWDLFNNHPDHRNTARLVLDAVTYARIPKIMKPYEAYRKPYPVFHYYNEDSHLPYVEIDITDTVEILKKATKFYAEIYGWKNWDLWIERRKLRIRFSTGLWYAEKFNINMGGPKPEKYLV